MDPNRVHISAADLFLLERWQADSAVSPAGQRESIFTEFVGLGVCGRQPYADQLIQRDITTAAGLSEYDRDLLASIRQPVEERQPASGGGIWLRTFYGPGSDTTFATILQEAQVYPLPPPYHNVFDNASLYDFGPEGWRRIFLRMPQLLERARYAKDYKQIKQEALENAIENEEEDLRQVEEGGYDPEEDCTPWEDLYMFYHWAIALGNLYIVDEKTLSSEGPDAGKVFVVWYDECGRVVRWVRQTGRQVFDTIGLIEDGSVQESSPWIDAKVGEDYQWDAPLGPPYSRPAQTRLHER